MELQGKIINFLGDSITEGVGVADRENNRFDNVLLRRCGLKKVNNYGIGGTRIAHQTVPSEKARWDLDFCGRCFDMDRDADIVVVFGGVNDYFHGDAPFGQIGDTTRDTFCGSVDYLVTKIRELYPDAVHVFLAPAHCHDDDMPSKSIHKPVQGLPLEAYVNAILEIASAHGFYTLNMYEKLGIDPKKQEEKEAFTIDGTHFNDAGHAIIADRIEEFLKSL